jgi:hypothetical protein
VLLTLAASLCRPITAYSTKESGYAKGHNFIIKKAVEYIQKKETSPAKDYPLDEYLPDLVFGSWYADNYDYGRHTDDCRWYIEFVVAQVEIKKYRCDMIHHYGLVGKKLRAEKWGITVDAGNTGQIAAPNYSRVLFEQAIKFWPGGVIPELSSLPRKYAGYIEAPLDRDDLGECFHRQVCLRGKREAQSNITSHTHGHIHHHLSGYTWVGSDPHSRKEGRPKWPPWAAAGWDPVESTSNAMKYLGWSLHLMQDITVPQNAKNLASDDSEHFEEKMDDYMGDGSFGNLPVLTGTVYRDSSVPVFVPGDYRDMETLTKEVISRTHDLYRKGGGLKKTASYIYIMDMAIKMTARGIEMFFEELAWEGGELDRGGIDANPSHCWIRRNTNLRRSGGDCNSNDAVICFEGPYGHDGFGCVYESDCDAIQYGYDGCVVIQPECKVVPPDTLCGTDFPGPVWCGPENKCKFVSTCFAEAAGYNVDTDSIESNQQKSWRKVNGPTSEVYAGEDKI